jgi:CBS domain-containing protein
MQVRDFMTKNPTCCTPDTTLQEVARMMVDCDCGMIPVVESRENPIPQGTVTDRDIVCRLVAQGRNPLECSASDCMSRPAVTINVNADVEDCIDLMERHQIRRLMAVDDNGRLAGVIAVADIARVLPQNRSGEVMHEVSREIGAPASIH